MYQWYRSSDCRESRNETASREKESCMAETAVKNYTTSQSEWNRIAASKEFKDRGRQCDSAQGLHPINDLAAATMPVST
jgi:hypothetical protein